MNGKKDIWTTWKLHLDDKYSYDKAVLNFTRINEEINQPALSNLLFIICTKKSLWNVTTNTLFSTKGKQIRLSFLYLYTYTMLYLRSYIRLC